MPRAVNQNEAKLQKHTVSSSQEWRKLTGEIDDAKKEVGKVQKEVRFSSVALRSFAPVSCILALLKFPRSPS